MAIVQIVILCVSVYLIRFRKFEVYILGILTSMASLIIAFYINGSKYINNPNYKRLKQHPIPEYASNNAHMYYIVCNDLAERSEIINHLNRNGILSVFHYLSLHKSLYYRNKYKGEELPESDRYSDCLLRLPLYYELSESNVNAIMNLIKDIIKSGNNYQ